jgi:Family of unknown function (DUF6152)
MSRLTLLLILAPASIWAHHSLAAEYDTSKPVSLNGVMTSLDWRNPHAWIYLDVKNASGTTEKWQCELGSPNAMIRAGFGKKAASPGDEITLDGVLAKDGSKTCSTRVVKAKDGKILFSQSAADRAKQ